MLYITSAMNLVLERSTWNQQRMQKVASARSFRTPPRSSQQRKRILRPMNSAFSDNKYHNFMLMTKLHQKLLDY